ncbi:hypothetical protein K443DRAFT_635250 [Laccaria amethystina LaAM-08-1]|uniref:Uncharacterized protein n=1 Tax=Laccaria amethystina LaAM-08-1 TaxID=1095629 RepID=A0A0C9XMB9_9AGAR|nr:hypothetical protein K443DRAFT_635250 [Laccaria amethystina LaAM-08-1]
MLNLAPNQQWEKGPKADRRPCPEIHRQMGGANHPSEQSGYRRDGWLLSGSCRDSAGVQHKTPFAVARVLSK